MNVEQLFQLHYTDCSISQKKKSEIYLILIINDDAMVAIFKRASHRAVKFFFHSSPVGSSPSPVLSPQKRAQASIEI